MKKVVILLIVGVAAAVAGFFVLRDYFAQAQIKVRLAELGGLVSSGAGDWTLPLERDWWHRNMPSMADEFSPAELAADPMGPMGRNDWVRFWKDENTDLGGQGVIRVVDESAVNFLERLEEGPWAGGWRVSWVWHQGVPNSGYGQRATYEGIWHHDEQFWRLARLKQLSRADADAPVKK